MSESAGRPRLRSSSAASASGRYSISTGATPGRRQAEAAMADGDWHTSIGHRRDHFRARAEQVGGERAQVGLADEARHACRGAVT